jgi:hypothetical protein
MKNLKYSHIFHIAVLYFTKRTKNLKYFSIKCEQKSFQNPVLYSCNLAHTFKNCAASLASLTYVAITFYVLKKLIPCFR